MAPANDGRHGHTRRHCGSGPLGVTLRHAVARGGRLLGNHGLLDRARAVRSALLLGEDARPRLPLQVAAGRRLLL